MFLIIISVTKQYRVLYMSILPFVSLSLFLSLTFSSASTHHDRPTRRRDGVGGRRRTHDSRPVPPPLFSRFPVETTGPQFGSPARVVAVGAGDRRRRRSHRGSAFRPAAGLGAFGLAHRVRRAPVRLFARDSRPGESRFSVRRSTREFADCRGPAVESALNFAAARADPSLARAAGR